MKPSGTSCSGRPASSRTSRSNAPKLVADLQRQTQSELARVSQQMENRQRSVEQAMSTLSSQTRDLEAQTNRQLKQQARPRCSAGSRNPSASCAAIPTRRWRASSRPGARRSPLSGTGSEPPWLSWNRRSGDGKGVVTGCGDLAARRRSGARRDPRRAAARALCPGGAGGAGPAAGHRAGQCQPGAVPGRAGPGPEAYHDLSELRLEIELRERAWTGQHTLTYQALLRLDRLAEQNARQVIEAAGAGNDTPVTVDVDFWSEGALSELRSTVADLLARVNDTTTPLSTDDLRQLEEERVPELERQLTDITHDAHVRTVRLTAPSQRAEVVAQTLDESAGYVVGEALYEREDYRRAFMAKLQAANGNEIVVSVAPAPDESGQCVLHVLSYDYDTVAEEILDERARTITRELKSQGIPAADQGCEVGEPDPAMLDFDRVRQPARPATIPGTVVPADAGR